jgi:hypothetical protein
MPYHFRLTSNAKRELDKEVAYSVKCWGKHHAKKGTFAKIMWKWGIPERITVHIEFLVTFPPNFLFSNPAV